MGKIDEYKGFNGEPVTVRQMNEHIYMIKDNGSNGFLVIGNEKAALIDTMYGNADYKEICGKYTPLPVTVINTHAHPDHVAGNIFFDEVCMNSKDIDLFYMMTDSRETKDFMKKHGRKMPKIRTVREGDTFDLGGLHLDVYEFPGHTMGGIMLLLREDRILFTGDAINRHLWMQFNVCTTLEELVSNIDRYSFLKEKADRILHGHTDDFDPVSLFDDVRAGAVDIIEGRTKDDEDYKYFDGICKIHKYPGGAIVYDPKYRNYQTARFLEEHEYGVWRSGEKVTYEYFEEEEKAPENPEMAAFFEKMFGSLKGGRKYRINVERSMELPDAVQNALEENEGNNAGTENNAKASAAASSTRRSSFTVTMFLPKDEDRFLPDGKCPVIIGMHPILPKEYAMKKGYALIFLNAAQVASDDTEHRGCFYDLYPYADRETTEQASGSLSAAAKNMESQTGVLSAWAWGASKVLDALEAGLADEYKIDLEGTVITGVSRYGKAAAVCGAFENRFRLTAPVCSGAGGLALYNVFSEGKTYDLTAVGGPAEYTYSQNEPLSCLQSDAERGWFNDAFLQYKTPGDIPIDQNCLPVLAMDKDRFYFIIAAMMSEDWVNAPSMWECFTRAKKVYDENGLSDHIVTSFHREGHAVLEEDIVKLIAYFNKMAYGIGDEMNVKLLQEKVFIEK